MSFSRFAIGFPRGLKVIGLSDAAFRLWASAIDVSREQLTDGKINTILLSLIPRGNGKVGWPPSVISELIAAGLWDRVSDTEWEIHDFLDWQDSAAQVKGRRETARERMRTVRGKNKKNNPLGVTGDVRANNQRTEERTTDERSQEVRSTDHLSLSSISSKPDPDPPDRSGSPPPGPQPIPRGLGGDARKRRDVLQLHAAWKDEFGFKEHQFRKTGYCDNEADTLAGAIDTHGFEACLRALEHAKRDGMVSGRDDERRVKHESIGYIFGNTQAFARILRLADEAERKATTPESPSDMIARLKAL